MAKSGNAEIGATDKSPGAAWTPQGTVPPGGVRFDTSQLKSSYCNVCSGASTREEVVIDFRVNQNWDMGSDKLEVDLHHRIVMSPFAAKRLPDMINRLIDEYESRYGKLEGQGGGMTLERAFPVPAAGPTLRPGMPGMASTPFPGARDDRAFLQGWLTVLLQRVPAHLLPQCWTATAQVAR